jgi:hypothetical protein
MAGLGLASCRLSRFERISAIFILHVFLTDLRSNILVLLRVREGFLGRTTLTLTLSLREREPYMPLLFKG